MSSAAVLKTKKRGIITIPQDIRNRLDLSALENPILIANEVDGTLILEPASAIPVRDISKKIWKLGFLRMKALWNRF